MFYINDKGEVREAIRYLGEKTKRQIQKKFNCSPSYLGNYYFLKNYEVKWQSVDYFEKHWRPIREDRVRLADKIFRLVIVELEKKQHKNDDWIKEDWLTLRKWLKEEFNELGSEIYEFEVNRPIRSAENMRAEAAHLAIVAGMLVDKADSVKELDEMWNEEASNE